MAIEFARYARIDEAGAPIAVAAARAASECLGRTLVPGEIDAVPIIDDAQYSQGDRDGIIKRYHFQVFKVKTTWPCRLFPGVIVEWLTWKDFLERRPISQTAKHLIELRQGL